MPIHTGIALYEYKPLHKDIGNDPRLMLLCNLYPEHVNCYTKWYVKNADIQTIWDKMS